MKTNVTKTISKTSSLLENLPKCVCELSVLQYLRGERQDGKGRKGGRRESMFGSSGNTTVTVSWVTSLVADPEIKIGLQVIY